MLNLYDMKIIFFNWFFLQVLEAISPPYTLEFVLMFLPMVENEEITGTTRGDVDVDPVSEFIGKLKKILNNHFST